MSEFNVYVGDNLIGKGKTMKVREVRSTLEAEIKLGRALGNSTRQVDKAVQLLFEGYKVLIQDHHQNGTNHRANNLLLKNVILRLKFEHMGLWRGDHCPTIKVDKSKMTIEIVYVNERGIKE